MPKALAMAECERRLMELGCSAVALRHKLRELEDHHEDLKLDALEEGLSEADAEARADRLLGEPVALAEYLAAGLRQSSWWGRHPIIGFCVLPPIAIMAFLAAGLWADSIIGKLFFTREQLSALADEPGLKFYTAVFLGTYYAAIVFTTLLFCRLARRTITGPRWSLITSLVCAINGLLFYMNVHPHELNIGYSTDPQWLSALIPLTLAAVLWLRWKKTERHITPPPTSPGNWHAKKSAVGRTHPPTIFQRRHNCDRRNHLPDPHDTHFLWLLPSVVRLTLR